ncbi:hypothetical protein Hdeb2414_s0016g00495921 [Helianthus debilis subsp. tardiflorus]
MPNEFHFTYIQYLEDDIVFRYTSEMLIDVVASRYYIEKFLDAVFFYMMTCTRADNLRRY